MAKKSSERFRSVRNKKSKSSEGFGTLPNTSEKTPDHTLTIREVAKMFENAGVPRTERAILSWCYPNKQGITKLNCYLDTAERKWFITPSSVDAAIKEEQNRLKNKGETSPSEAKPNSSEAFGTASEGFGSPSERFRSEPKSFGSLPNVSGEGSGEADEQLRMQLRDMEITNRAKDMYIERLQADRENLVKELTNKSHQIGQLETRLKLLQSGGDKGNDREAFAAGTDNDTTSEFNPDQQEQTENNPQPGDESNK